MKAKKCRLYGPQQQPQVIKGGYLHTPGIDITQVSCCHIARAVVAMACLDMDVCGMKTDIGWCKAHVLSSDPIPPRSPISYSHFAFAGLCSDGMARGLAGSGRTAMENGGGCLGSETASPHADQWFRGAPQGYGDPAGGYAESGERGKMLGFPGALGPFEPNRAFPMWGSSQERGQQPK